MGYFSVDKEPGVEGELQAALKNIELWEEMDFGGEYLISGFVKAQIQNAISLLSSEGEEYD